MSDRVLQRTDDDDVQGELDTLVSNLKIDDDSEHITWTLVENALAEITKKMHTYPNRWTDSIRTSVRKVIESGLEYEYMLDKKTLSTHARNPGSSDTARVLALKNAFSLLVSTRDRKLPSLVIRFLKLNDSGFNDSKNIIEYILSIKPELKKDIAKRTLIQDDNMTLVRHAKELFPDIHETNDLNLVTLFNIAQFRKSEIVEIINSDDADEVANLTVEYTDTHSRPVSEAHINSNIKSHASINKSTDFQPHTNVKTTSLRETMTLTLLDSYLAFVTNLPQFGSSVFPHNTNQIKFKFLLVVSRAELEIYNLLNTRWPESMSEYEQKMKELVNRYNTITQDIDDTVTELKRTPNLLIYEGDFKEENQNRYNVLLEAFWKHTIQTVSVLGMVLDVKDELYAGLYDGNSVYIIKDWVKLQNAVGTWYKDIIERAIRIFNDTANRDISQLISNQSLFNATKYIVEPRVQQCYDNLKALQLYVFLFS